MVGLEASFVFGESCPLPTYEDLGKIGQKKSRQKAALRRISLPMMGLVRLELTTSRLSGVRSNLLSYKPRFS